MDSVLDLKKKGNREYSDDDYSASCNTYGKAIGEMMSIENQTGTSLGPEFNRLKSVLFSNLAAANLKLENYEAVRRCCNASIVFLNEPELPMLDLGLEDRNGDNILDNAPLKEPVAAESRSFAAKVLYRRALALSHIHSSVNSLNFILQGLRPALALQPTDASIRHLITELEEKKQKKEEAEEEKKNRRIASNDRSTEFDEGGRMFTVTIRPVRAGLLVNGGPCARRKGLWSQSIETVTVYLPLSMFLCPVPGLEAETPCADLVLSSYAREDTLTVAVLDGITSRDLVVTFNRESIIVDTAAEAVGVENDGNRPKGTHHLALEYFIDPAASTWQVDALYSAGDIDSALTPSPGSSQSPINPAAGVIGSANLPPSHLVLHLAKTPSVEWFPGCEWWSSVFIGDEAIETTTCSVGTDGSELPPEATQRAAREHQRFVDLDDTSRREELEALMKLKRDTVTAVQNGELELQQALAQQAGRSEMLSALSAEFPSVYFGAK